MRFTFAAALLAFSSSVFAQTPGFDAISKPAKGEEVPAGSTYVVTWEPSSNYTGTVTIDLLGGVDQGHLNPLTVLANGVDSAAGQYSWAVDKSLGTLNTYGLRITLDSDKTIFQYSFPFVIKGSSSGGSSSSSSSGDSSSTSPSSTQTSATETSTTVTTPTITSAPTGGNLSTTSSPTKTVVTLTTTSSKTTGTSVPSNPAAVVGASSLALFGGLAAAVLAL